MTKAGWCGALLAAASLTGTGFARAVTQGTDAIQLDQRLQELKHETLLLSRDLLAVEQAALYPDQSRTTVYVNVKVGGFLLESMSVRIDEGETLSYTYSDSEARALLKDGWHRLLRVKLDPGSYRLRAEFSGRFFDARPTDAPVRGKLETVFEKGLSELDLVLPVSRNTRLDKPGLPEVARLEARKLRPARNVWLPQPKRFESALHGDLLGGEDDPRYRSALFLKHDARYYSALTELLDIARDIPNPAALSPAYHWLLADCYLAFGMEGPAEKLYREIAAASPDPVDIARAHLKLAEFEYQRGYFADATNRLLRQREQLPRALLDEWRQLLTSTLLAQARYNEAIDVLTLGADAGNLPPALRYNLAVALIRDGRVAEGRRELNQVGTMDVTDLDTLALRDKANLTLGYHYLQSQHGENAKAVFGRIRVAGPHSNRALLGLGWAELAPLIGPKEEAPVEGEGKDSDESLGSLLRPGFVDTQGRGRLKVESESDSGLSPQEHAALLRALIPWLELSQRDPMDPAVQEGMLAIPWALDRLHAYQQSLKYYLDAIAALETARRRMDEAMRSIRGGRMVETIVRRDMHAESGWHWRLRDLPDAPETYFLQSLLAEHRFQEALKNYRDARLLSFKLDAWGQRLDELERIAPVVEKASVERQVARAREDWQPDWGDTVVWLRYSGTLSPPGAHESPLARDEGPAPVDLRVLEAPEHFDGTLQQLQPLRDRVRLLNPRIAETGSAQGAILTAVSTRELEGQKKQIERYLTEARFAVARIYDRQQKAVR